MTTNGKIRKHLSLTISALMIASLVGLLLAGTAIAGDTATMTDKAVGPDQMGPGDQAVVQKVTIGDGTVDGLSLRIDSFKVSQEGTASDSQIASVSLWVDKGAPGFQGSGTDIQIGSTVSNPSFPVVIGDNTDDIACLAIGDTDNENVLVVVTVASDATEDGETIKTKLDATDLVTVGTTTWSSDNGIENDGTPTTLDTTAPKIVSLDAVDTDTDGYLDKITLTMDDNLTLNHPSPSAFTVTDEDGTALSVDSVATSENYVTITLTDNKGGTGAPTVTYVAGAAVEVKDDMGIAMEGAENTATDGATPYLREYYYKDDNNDGQVDNIYLGYSENIAASSPEVEDYTLNSGTKESASIYSDNYVRVYVSELPSNDTSPTLTIAYADINDSITDGTNAADNFTAKTLDDKAAPVIQEAKTYSTSQIDVTFTEDLVGTTVSKDNFTVELNTISSASETAAGVVSLTLAQEIGTGATPLVTYTQGVLEDLTGNLAESDTATPQDKLGPILVSAVWNDINGDGYVDMEDNIVFTFNEAMDNTKINAANVDNRLLPTDATTYDAESVSWSADNTQVTVLLGSGENVEKGATVDPDSAVTDVSANADETGVAKKIASTVGPVVLDGIHYFTISDAIGQADPGDTIEVGTAYDNTNETFPITVNVDNLTITSTGATEDTVIYAENVTAVGIILVSASDVTIEGFTIQSCDPEDAPFIGSGIYTNNPGTTLNDLIIREVPTGIYTSGGAVNFTVENSEIRDIRCFGIYLQQENVTIRNNVIENVAYAGWATGIELVEGSSGIRVIENNTFRNNDYSICYSATDNTGLTIENNNFLNGNAAAIDIGSDATAGVIINAKYNYWGDDSGPSGEGYGDGEAVSENVDYSPWLTAEDGQHYDFTYVLDEGLNLVSLPLIPDDNSIGTVLGSTANVDSVWSYDEQTKTWDGYDPNVGGDLTAMVDGEGYWIRIEGTADNKTVLAFNGHAYVSGEEVPSAYDVYVGWNLMGFKGTTTITRVSYLGAVDGFTERCYQAPRGTYGIVENTTSLTPGYGYWLAVTEDGTIYP